MTAPDIRAQAIEALKAHQPHEDVYLYCTCGVQLADDGFPAHVVDALAEAGLLPTEAEHGVILAGDGDDPAGWSIGIGGDAPLNWSAPEARIRRLVGPWVREVKR